jgi:small subunit ribosomal protein S6
MRDYEVTVVLKPDLDDETKADLISRLEQWMTHGEEEGDKPVGDHWGLRALVYLINKYNEGDYYLYMAKLDTVKISDMERNFQYIDDILRHLVVRRDS